MTWLNSHRYAGAVAIAGFLVLITVLVNGGAPTMLQISAAILIGLGMDPSAAAWRGGMRPWQAENVYFGVVYGTWFWLWMCIAIAEDSAAGIAIHACGAVMFATLIAAMNRGAKPQAWEQYWSRESRLSLSHWLFRVAAVVGAVAGVWLDRIPEVLWFGAFIGAQTPPMRDWVGPPEKTGRIVYWAAYAVAMGIWIVHISGVY